MHRVSQDSKLILCLLLILVPSSLLTMHEPGSGFATSMLEPTASQPIKIQSISQDSAAILSASSQSDFVNFANNPVPSSGRANLIDEPSVANKGPIVFYTGNHYAARSSDGGFSWIGVDPFAGMTDFCCDQDVIYIPSRSLFIWERMGDPGTVGVNHIRLGVSSEATNWVFYDIYPYDINTAWTNQWIDYPNLAFSNNYAYLTGNMFSGTESYQKTIILRFSLDSLKTNRLSYSYYSASATGIFNLVKVFNFATVQGATDTMYWGAHVDCGFLYLSQCIRLYAWREDLGSVTWTDVQVSSFSTIESGGASCSSPDGGDVCARMDSRILGGWIAHGIAGFLWGANRDTSHPYPYVDMLRIDVSSKSLIDQPTLWSSNFAWLYAYVSPNARGDLGIVTFCSGASTGACGYPTFVAGFYVGSASQAPWDLYRVSESTNGPSPTCLQDATKPCWGDYVRGRPFNGNGNVWIASGFVLQGGSEPSDVSPRFIVFGHSQDGPTLTMRYATTGGDGDHPNPKLTYTTSGVVQVAELQRYDTTYNVNYGSHWSVSTELPGSNGEKWVLSQASNGTVYEKASLILSYDHQPVASPSSPSGPLGLSVAVIVVLAGVAGMAGVFVWIFRMERRRKALGPPPPPLGPVGP